MEVVTTCPWIDCGAELEGLGTFCAACQRYTEDASGVEADDGAAPVGASPTSQGRRQVVTLPLPPSANAMWRAVPATKKGLADAVIMWSQGQGTWKAVKEQLYAKMPLSKEGRQFKKDAAAWLDVQRTALIDGDVRLCVTFYFARRGSDLDNRVKPLLDVLEGVLFSDDVQVVELWTVKRYDKNRPRAVVVAEPDDGLTQLDPGAEFQYEVSF